jgi:hypothetical protein
MLPDSDALPVDNEVQERVVASLRHVLEGDSQYAH